MGAIRALLLPAGVHEAPQGTLHATPERLRRWAAQFRRMKAERIKIPIAWAHAKGALPHEADSPEERQYREAKFNAGYLSDLEYDPAEKALYFCGDVPGCEVDDKGNLVHWERLSDGREVKCAIGEVSAGIKNWKDGQGRKWPDSVIHVALCPRPVVAGQDGFRALATDGDGTFYLSLSTLKTLGADMAKEEDDDLDPAEEEAQGAERVGEEEAAVETTPPEPPPEPPAEIGAEDQGDARLSEAVQVLEAHGLHLPPDTTLANLIERICVAGHAKHKGAGEDEEEEEGAAGEDAGATYDGTPTEEQRPVMMSLATAKTKQERVMIAGQQEAHRKKLLAIVERLKKRGMPVHRADAYRERLAGYTLALDPETAEVSPRAIDRELAIWNEALPKKEFDERYLSTVVKKEPRPTMPTPAERAKASEKAQEEAGDELATLAGAPPRKK